jgi:hypothetical protein
MQFRNKQSKPLAWEKVLTMMLSGKPVSKGDLDTALGPLAYRLSTYIWCIKTLEGGVVKVVKDGRKIDSYQLMNTDKMQKYMDGRNNVASIAKPAKAVKVVKAKPVKVVKAKPVKKLQDLNATPVMAKSPESPDEVMKITEITTTV